MNPQKVFISLAIIVVVIWLAVLGSVLAGEGYESILRRNMFSSGMNAEQVDVAINLPRTLDDVLVADLVNPYIPPCTLAIIAYDGTSALTILIPDTLWIEPLFDLREAMKK